MLTALLPDAYSSLMLVSYNKATNKKHIGGKYGIQNYPIPLLETWLKP